MSNESFENNDLAQEENIGATGTVGAVQETFDKFLAAADVTAVYGEPMAMGETVVVPAAEVVSVMGFGLGYGGSNAPGQQGGAGGGGGGGGRVFSRPVAAIVIAPEGVRVEPVVDVTKIGLAALTAFGFMAATLWRMSRPGRHRD